MPMRTEGSLNRELKKLQKDRKKTKKQYKE